jgi:hypothetical protein
MQTHLSAFLSDRWVALYRSYLPTAQVLWDDHSLETSQFGVESSTTRGIPTGSRGANGPQEMYRAWAGPQLAAMLNDSTLPARLDTQAAFDDWHASLAASLAVHWDVGTAGAMPLSIAHRFKLLDLFVRWLRIQASRAPALAARCEQFGHIPLDRKSLHILSETFSGIGLAGPFSMGDVHTEAAYRFYQMLAREVCAVAGGSPLLFDVFCWNHPEAHALYNKKPARRFMPVPQMAAPAVAAVN